MLWQTPQLHRSQRAKHRLSPVLFLAPRQASSNDYSVLCKFQGTPGFHEAVPGFYEAASRFAW